MQSQKKPKIYKFAKWALLCGLTSTIVVYALGFGISNLLGDYFNLAWENFLFQARTKLDHNIKNQPLKNILIVKFDKETDMKLKSFWPYDRIESAKVIDFIRIAKAKAVLLDVLYSSPNKDKPESDKALIEAVKKAGNVYLGANYISAGKYSNIDNEEENKLSTKFALNTKVKDSYADFDNMIFDGPFPELMKAAKGIGCFNAAPNKDLFKYTYLFLCDDNKCLPSLPVSLFIDLIGTKDLNVLSNNRVKIKDIDIPVIDYNEYFINWNQNPNVQSTDKNNFYKVIPAWKIIFTYNNILQFSKRLRVSPDKIVEYWLNENEKVDGIEFFIDPDEFKHKIVFIGVSSSGAQDHINTPFGIMPGVYNHAITLDNLISQSFIQKPNTVITFTVILLLCLLTSFTVILASAKDSLVIIALPILYLIIYSFSAMELFITKNILLNWSLPISGIIISYFITFICYFMLEGKDKKLIKNAMSNYLSPQVLRVVLENPEELKPSASKRKPLTIFFSDIRGFTSFSESNPPELVVRMLNEYHQNMTEIIFNNDGTLDKFIGDAVMAFWNAPVEVEDHAYKAVKTALEMKEKLAELNSIWEKVYKHTISIGMGINSEEVVVGNIGSEKFMDYTVIGDGVNLAARLESLNKEYSTTIIISEHTYRKVKDRVKVRSLGKVKVKGKSLETEIFELISLIDNDTNKEVQYE